MIWQVEDFTREVRTAMDENAHADALRLEEDSDTLDIDGIIRSKIEEAVRYVTSSAPVELLDGGISFADSICWGEMRSGWVQLPDDFFRLIVFRMSDWSRPVYEAISALDARYPLQHSKFAGVRGSAQKPVVAIVQSPTGRRLEFYSCKDNSAHVMQAVYFPYPKIDRGGGIDIPERLVRPAVYEAAGLSLQAIGSEAAAAMFENVKGLIGL